MITHLELRKRFARFWKSNGHVEVPGIPLVPQNDPTTLFTGSGMQQLVPNLLGEPHPLGTRLFNIQDCFRAQDIEEVGDNRHDTFFEMMGNWSLGDYFKKEQLTWFFTFLTQELDLDPTRLYVTAFKGDMFAPRDNESETIWRDIFSQHTGAFVKMGIQKITVNENPEQGMEQTNRIFYYDATHNWWSRAGEPDKMPVGEIGGPDSEVFFDFDPDQKKRIHEGSLFSDKPCHPTCDCGRFVEIGNSVFMEYVKTKEGFKPLPMKNVDFGGGLERMLMAAQNKSDVFEIDVFKPIVEVIADKEYHNSHKQKYIRIIADHIRSATQLAADGVTPGPNEQGYVMRRLIRRAVRSAHIIGLDPLLLDKAIKATQDVYEPFFEPITRSSVNTTIMDEILKYLKTLESGRKTIVKTISAKARIINPMIQENKTVLPEVKLNGNDIFNLYQSIGIPAEEVADIAKEMGATVDMTGFEEAKKSHIDTSRAGSEQKFKGGLADHSEQVVKFHTATHLLHQALCDVLGPIVRQEGSNITGERLRFDFRCDHKPTPEEMNQIETIIHKKIEEALPVNFIMLPKETAKKLGAKSFFREKYPDHIKMYVVGATQKDLDALKENPNIPLSSTIYSLEFCGGPHVTNTGDIGTISVYKVEKIGKELYRVYAK